MELKASGFKRMDNGHYLSADGQEFMSIWSFNQRFHTKLPTYDTATKLTVIGAPYIEVAAEISKVYDTVKAFKVSDIKQFVRVNRPSSIW
ncbi:hypothetical protein SAMN04488136_13013 [Vibrio xiamenensis]|uniref:Uncharacterized protein n=1 Tax=Vibrio xiamenensis TaxID=861298 RepID=A0A1G8FDV6_9VIBR|nr:hypothetical protein [Vibrio xiamenensis]SDH80364.1 hypothetical protein SAMN04488136_13013 [Vibrio xiamenensis]